MKFDRLMEQISAVFALVVLVGGALIVVAPFVTPLLWGAILAYCTFQPYRRLAVAFGGRRIAAALLIVLTLLVVLIWPVVYAGAVFAARAPDIALAAQARLSAGVPPLPDWLTQLPMIGPRIDAAWAGLAARDPEVVARLRELAAPVLAAGLHAALSVLQGLGLLILSVVFAAFFYVDGDGLAFALEGGMQRIAGSRAPFLLQLVGSTVKGVVYGILGTSLVEAILCAFGYWIAGLPSPALLGLATFFLAILPGGPLVVVVPGAIWLAQHGQAGWAVFLPVWSLAVSVAIDNVIKPIIIGKSSRVPFILIMLGVIGGATAFGLLGVFVGPTVLAVVHAVARDWVAAGHVQRPAVEGAPAFAGTGGPEVRAEGPPGQEAQAGQSVLRSVAQQPDGSGQPGRAGRVGSDRRKR